MKTQNSWRLTRVQLLKVLSHLYASCKNIIDGKQKSSTHTQAPNFIGGQQFNYCLVFERTVKRENLSCDK